MSTVSQPRSLISARVIGSGGAAYVSFQSGSASRTESLLLPADACACISFHFAPGSPRDETLYARGRWGRWVGSLSKLSGQVGNRAYTRGTHAELGFYYIAPTRLVWFNHEAPPRGNSRIVGGWAV